MTVVDISPAMLELDRQVAAGRGLQIETVEASMDHLMMFDSARFDIVIHPVSSCYVSDIVAVYRQIARIMRPRGTLHQPAQTASKFTGQRETNGGRLLYLGTVLSQRAPLPQVVGSPHREFGTLEFLHRWEQLLGGNVPLRVRYRRLTRTTPRQTGCRPRFVRGSLPEHCSLRADQSADVLVPRPMWKGLDGGTHSFNGKPKAKSKVGQTVAFGLPLDDREPCVTVNWEESVGSHRSRSARVNHRGLHPENEITRRRAHA